MGSCWLAGCCGGSVVIVGFMEGGSRDLAVDMERNRVRVERTKRGRMRYIINKAALSGGGWRQPTGRREPCMAKQVPVQDQNRYLLCGKSLYRFQQNGDMRFYLLAFCIYAKPDIGPYFDLLWACFGRMRMQPSIQPLLVVIYLKAVWRPTLRTFGFRQPTPPPFTRALLFRP